MKPTHLIKAVNGYKYFAYMNELRMWIDHSTGYVIHYHEISYVEPIEETQDLMEVFKEGDIILVRAFNDQPWAERTFIQFLKGYAICHDVNDKDEFYKWKYWKKKELVVTAQTMTVRHLLSENESLNAVVHIVWHDSKPVSVRLIEKDSK